MRLMVYNISGNESWSRTLYVVRYTFWADRWQVLLDGQDGFIGQGLK